VGAAGGDAVLEQRGVSFRVILEDAAREKVDRLGEGVLGQR
jgi:hypothetical protein